MRKRDHCIPYCVRQAEARQTSQTRCDMCGQPATVIVRCTEARFASFRCPDHAIGIVEAFAHQGFTTTVDPLVADESMTQLPDAFDAALFVDDFSREMAASMAPTLRAARNVS